MAENTPDSDIDLKKRARRRLVGAVALALLAAVILPVVMDSKPRPAVQDIQVRIPGQDSSNFTSRVGLGAPAPAPLPPVAPVSPMPTAKPQPVPEPAPVAAPAPAKPVVIPHDVKSNHVQPTNARHEGKVQGKSDAKQTKSAEVLRAERILAGGDASAAASGGSWILQLGAYAESGNVRALQSKLKELGYPSYTEKVTTPHGARVRVRAGPFSSKAAAVKAQAALKKIGAGGPPGGVLAQK